MRASTWDSSVPGHVKILFHNSSELNIYRRLLPLSRNTPLPLQSKSGSRIGTTTTGRIVVVLPLLIHPLFFLLYRPDDKYRTDIVHEYRHEKKKRPTRLMMIRHGTMTGSSNHITIQRTCNEHYYIGVSRDVETKAEGVVNTSR